MLRRIYKTEIEYSELQTLFLRPAPNRANAAFTQLTFLDKYDRLFSRAALVLHLRSAIASGEISAVNKDVIPRGVVHVRLGFRVTDTRPQNGSTHGFVRQTAVRAFAVVITLFARFVTAVRATWIDNKPSRKRRIYFANHASHADFILIWIVLPPRLRRRTRPVAGADYWLKSPLKSFIGRDVFNAVLIDRNRQTRMRDPVEIMQEAIDDGASLILFPEGTRNETNEPLQPFKAGLYNLARSRPQIELVPVWIENLNRVMPKGEFIPVPLMCSVTFGPSLHVMEDEEVGPFLSRAQDALLALKPVRNGSAT